VPRAKRKANPVPARCTQHTVKDDWDMCGLGFDADERIERGEHQEQCAKCWRWLWPDERGPNFVSTGARDTD
jgi:hypothetical protein